MFVHKKRYSVFFDIAKHVPPSTFEKRVEDSKLHMNTLTHD